MNHRENVLPRSKFFYMLVLLVMIVTGLGACAGRNTPPPPPGSLAARFQSDSALFQEGYAETYLFFMSELQSLQKAAEDLRNQGRKDRETAAGKQVELEKELRELRPLIEKGHTDAVRLQQENQALRQENDQLKKNIDSLKLLEIEMQRRDKLYR